MVPALPKKKLGQKVTQGTITYVVPKKTDDKIYGKNNRKHEHSSKALKTMGMSGN
jgi:hypothetical protein